MIEFAVFGRPCDPLTGEHVFTWSAGATGDPMPAGIPCDCGAAVSPDPRALEGRQ